MKKYILIITAIAVAILMVSSATAVPNTKSKTVPTKPINIQQIKINIKEKIEEINLLDIETNGIFDWLIELIKTIIQLVFRLIEIVYDLIRIVNLVERLIEALQVLIGLVQYLIEQILDLIPSQEMLT